MKQESKMSKLIKLLFLFTIGCSSAPKPEYKDEFWLGCMNSYFYWQTKSKAKVKFGEAENWCKKQKNIFLKQKNNLNKR